MKNLKINFSLSLLVLALMSLMLSSCERDQLVENAPEEVVLQYAKDLTIVDGPNEVTINIATDNKALLDAYTENTFTIEPMFDRPSNTTAQGNTTEVIEESPVTNFSESVRIDERSSKLQDGAIGYIMHVTPNLPKGLSSCNSPNVHTNSRNFGWVRVDGGICSEAKISTKKYSWSYYTQKAYASALCTGDQRLEGGKSNTNRCKIQICPGPSYSYGFYN